MQFLFSRLRRITSGATWIPEIDGLRFVAIFSVVLFHLGGEVYSKSGLLLTNRQWYVPLLRCISHGSRGVEIFFVISGFILGRPFARHTLLGDNKVRLGGYYLRRLTRLEPPYLVNLVIIAICIFIYIPGTRLPDLGRHLLASAVYLHGLIYNSISTINAVTWSLEIEVQFYVLVPLLVAFYKVRSVGWRRGLLVLAMLLLSLFQEWAFQQSYWGRPQQFIYYTVIFYLQYFLAGFLLSDLYLTSFPRWRPSVAWDVTSLVCWPLLFYFDAWWRPTVLPFLILLVCIGAFRGIYFPRLFRLESIALIGGMCYSIYLWHFFIISLGFKVTRHLFYTKDYLFNLSMQGVLLLPFVLLLSTSYYLAIERPCMDPGWPQRLFRKLKAAPADTGTA
jgi:peptidoglycan/LPS O-acetylase OafA/YrhL